MLVHHAPIVPAELVDVQVDRGLTEIDAIDLDLRRPEAGGEGQVGTDAAEVLRPDDAHEVAASEVAAQVVLLPLIGLQEVGTQVLDGDAHVGALDVVWRRVDASTLVMEAVNAAVLGLRKSQRESHRLSVGLG